MGRVCKVWPKLALELVTTMAGDDWLGDIELDMVGEHLRGAPRPSALRPSHSLPAIASSGGSPDAAGGGRGRPAAPHPHNHGGAASSRPGLQRMFAAISVRNSSKGAETPGTGEEADGEKIDDEEKNTLKAEVAKELKNATANSTAMKRPASVAKPKGKGKGKPKGKPKGKAIASSSKPEPEDVNGDSEDDGEGDTPQKDEKKPEDDKLETPKAPSKKTKDDKETEATPKASPKKTVDTSSPKDSKKKAAPKAVGKAKNKAARKVKATCADPSKSIFDQRNKFIAAKKKEFKEAGRNLTKKEAHKTACELWQKSEEKQALLVGMSDAEKRKRKFM